MAAAAGEPVTVYPTRCLRPRDSSQTSHEVSKRKSKAPWRAPRSRMSKGESTSSSTKLGGQEQPAGVQSDNVKLNGFPKQLDVLHPSVNSVVNISIDDVLASALRDNTLLGKFDRSILKDHAEADCLGNRQDETARRLRTQPSRKAASKYVQSSPSKGKNGLVNGSLLRAKNKLRPRPSSTTPTRMSLRQLMQRSSNGAGVPQILDKIPVNVANSRSVPFVMLHQSSSNATIYDFKVHCEIAETIIASPSSRPTLAQDPMMTTVSPTATFKKVESQQSNQMQMGIDPAMDAEMEMVLVSHGDHDDENDDSWQLPEDARSPEMPTLTPISDAYQFDSSSASVSKQWPVADGHPLLQQQQEDVEADDVDDDEPRWKRFRKNSIRPFGSRKVRSWMQRRKCKFTCPDIDVVDGMEFLSFDSERDLDRFMRNNHHRVLIKPSTSRALTSVREEAGPSSSSSTSSSSSSILPALMSHLLTTGEPLPSPATATKKRTAGLGLPILPTKTSDITLIKGWRDKIFAAEAIAKSHLDPDVVRKLSWPQRMRLLSNFGRDELEERGLLDLISMSCSQYWKLDNPVSVPVIDKDHDNDMDDVVPSTSSVNIKDAIVSLRALVDDIDKDDDFVPATSSAEEPGTRVIEVAVEVPQKANAVQVPSILSQVEDPDAVPVAVEVPIPVTSTENDVRQQVIEPIIIISSPVDEATKSIVNNDDLKSQEKVEVSCSALLLDNFAKAAEASLHDDDDDDVDQFDRQSVESIDLGIFKSEPFDTEDLIQQPTADIPDPVLSASPNPPFVVNQTDDQEGQQPNKSVFVSEYLDNFLKNQSALNVSLTKSMEKTVHPDEIQTKVVWPSPELPVKHEGPAPCFGLRARQQQQQQQQPRKKRAARGSRGFRSRRIPATGVRGRYNSKFIMNSFWKKPTSTSKTFWKYRPASAAELHQQEQPQQQLQINNTGDVDEQCQKTINIVNEKPAQRGLQFVTLTRSNALFAVSALVKRSFIPGCKDKHMLDSPEDIREALSLPCPRDLEMERIRAQKCREFSVVLHKKDVLRSVKTLVNVYSSVTTSASTSERAPADSCYSKDRTDAFGHPTFSSSPIPSPPPATVVATPSTNNNRQPCQEEFCRMGCVCDSLKVRKRRRGHCGKVNCMFVCECRENLYGVLEKSSLHSVNLVTDDSSTNTKNSKQGQYTSCRPNCRREIKIPARLRDSVYFYKEDLNVVNVMKAVQKKNWTKLIQPPSTLPPSTERRRPPGPPPPASASAPKSSGSHLKYKAKSTPYYMKKQMTTAQLQQPLLPRQRPPLPLPTPQPQSSQNQGQKELWKPMTSPVPAQKEKKISKKHTSSHISSSSYAKNRPQMYPLAFRRSKIKDDVRRDAILNIRPIKEISQVEAEAYGHLLQSKYSPLPGLKAHKTTTTSTNAYCKPKKSQEQKQKDKFCDGFKPALGIRPRYPPTTNVSPASRLFLSNDDVFVSKQLGLQLPPSLPTSVPVPALPVDVPPPPPPPSPLSVTSSTSSSSSAANRPKLMELQQFWQANPVIKPAASRSIPAILRRSSTTGTPISSAGGTPISSPHKNVPTPMFQPAITACVPELRVDPPLQLLQVQQRSPPMTARKSLNPTLRAKINKQQMIHKWGLLTKRTPPRDRDEIVVKNLMEEMVQKVAFRLEVGETWQLADQNGRRARISCFRTLSSSDDQQMPLRKKLQQHQMSVRKMGMGQVNRGELQRATKTMSLASHKTKKKLKSPQAMPLKKNQKPLQSKPRAVTVDEAELYGSKNDDDDDDDEVTCLGPVTKPSVAGGRGHDGGSTSSTVTASSSEAPSPKQHKREQQRRNAILSAFTNLAMASSPVVKDIWSKKDPSVPITAFVFKMACTAIKRLQIHERSLLTIKQDLVRRRKLLFTMYSEYLKEYEPENQKLAIRNLSKKMSACCADRSTPAALASTSQTPAIAPVPMPTVAQKVTTPEVINLSTDSVRSDEELDVVKVEKSPRPTNMIEPHMQVVRVAVKAAAAAAAAIKFVEGDPIGKVGSKQIPFGQQMFIGEIGGLSSRASVDVTSATAPLPPTSTPVLVPVSASEKTIIQDMGLMRTIRLQRPYGACQWVQLKRKRETAPDQVSNTDENPVATKIVKVHSIASSTVVPRTASSFRTGCTFSLSSVVSKTNPAAKPTAAVRSKDPNSSMLTFSASSSRAAEATTTTATKLLFNPVSGVKLIQNRDMATATSGTASVASAAAVPTSAVGVRSLRPKIVGSWEPGKSSNTSPIAAAQGSTTLVTFPLRPTRPDGPGPKFVIGVLPATTSVGSSNGTTVLTSTTTTGSRMSTGVLMSPLVAKDQGHGKPVQQPQQRLQKQIVTIPLPHGARSFTLDGKTGVLIMNSALAASLASGASASAERPMEVATSSASETAIASSAPPSSAAQQLSFQQAILQSTGKCMVKTVSLLLDPHQQKQLKQPLPLVRTLVPASTLTTATPTTTTISANKPTVTFYKAAEAATLDELRSDVDAVDKSKAAASVDEAVSVLRADVDCHDELVMVRNIDEVEDIQLDVETFDDRVKSV